MLAHFVRIYLGHAPTVSEDESETIRARSLQRFKKYSDEVVRMLKERSDFFEAVSAEALQQAYTQLLTANGDEV